MKIINTQYLYMEWTTLNKDLSNVGFHFNFKKGDKVASSDSFYYDGFMEWSLNVYQRIEGVMKHIGTMRESDYIRMLIDNNK